MKDRSWIACAALFLLVPALLFGCSRTGSSGAEQWQNHQQQEAAAEDDVETPSEKLARKQAALKERLSIPKDGLFYERSASLDTILSSSQYSGLFILCNDRCYKPTCAYSSRMSDQGQSYDVGSDAYFANAGNFTLSVLRPEYQLILANTDKSDGRLSLFEVTAEGYAVPYNFQPYTLSIRNLCFLPIDNPTGFVAGDIEEVDGKSVSAEDNPFSWMNIGAYTLATAPQGQTYKIGLYDGTTFREFCIEANMKYFLYESGNIYTRVDLYAPVVKTKDGYFTVDVSGLDSGTYIVQDYRLHFGGLGGSYLFQIP